MKKTFTLSHPKIAYPRLIEAAKSDVKKYLKRERNKALPEHADFWGFDCKFGQSEELAEVIHVAAINEKMDFAESQEWPAFYLEILATAETRTQRPDSEKDGS
ncbi:DUF6172 family protein [Marinomonas transparens]|uniref:Uncharacterized protein n=1 Tax=Marinomonas transparens TaxID=2795388 RepID=A0A934N3A3_9GAMM|nr:DUF6172 family protein [Marinomonas transparens]MBJ7538763.1 hypothetical protein [Marinomonas transparens]